MPTDILTMLKDLIDPEVMGEMISAKASKKIAMLPYVRVDTTLEGREGDTITVPKFGYIGDAVEVGEGEEIPMRKMSTSYKKYTIKKIGVGVPLSDEAVLSSHGQVVAQATTQLATSIAQKTDNDAIDEAYEGTTTYVSGNIISYEELVKAIACFDEERNTEKVIFISPAQETQLRLDANFISADKYDGKVMVNGEVGKICNTRVVVSKKVRHENGYYYNPILKMEEDDETEDSIPALTIYLKRDTNVETERKVRTRTTEVSADKLYVVALTNESKVVVAKMVCGDTKLIVSPNPVEIEVEGSQVLTIDTDASDFTMKSDKTSIATVDKTSKKITGVKEGTCNVTITAQATDKNLTTVVIPVTVTAKTE